MFLVERYKWRSCKGLTLKACRFAIVGRFVGSAEVRHLISPAAPREPSSASAAGGKQQHHVLSHLDKQKSRGRVAGIDKVKTSEARSK